MPARPIKEERQRWYVYLLLKHFKGDTSRCARTMDISKRSLDMKEFIKKERKCDRNGGELPFEERETPTPEALKEECLKRMEEAIKLESDPAKLARAVETLNKLMDPRDTGKEKKSIAEAVADAIKK